jgi:hypothetical protein
MSIPFILLLLLLLLLLLWLLLLSLRLFRIARCSRALRSIAGCCLQNGRPLVKDHLVCRCTSTLYDTATE